MKELKTIIKCDNTLIAEEIRDALLEENISCMIHDETMDTAAGAYGALPGIAIKVYEENEQKAKNIINHIMTERKKASVWCPKCGSENIEKTALHHINIHRWKLVIIQMAIVWIIYFMLLFYINETGISQKWFHYIAIVLVILTVFNIYKLLRGRKANRHCKNCGHEFFKEE